MGSDMVLEARWSYLLVYFYKLGSFVVLEALQIYLLLQALLLCFCSLLFSFLPCLTRTALA